MVALDLLDDVVHDRELELVVVDVVALHHQVGHDALVGDQGEGQRIGERLIGPLGEGFQVGSELVEQIGQHGSQQVLLAAHVPVGPGTG